jgi:benzoyl-CoA reductase/2-hydroxyglutaryl-CoA dehydratase subunit BcrC/BadD/HgdB
MQLNARKTKVMIFNYTKNHQFATRISLNGALLETIYETTLLGTVISSDLTWHNNTEMITKKKYQRMTILSNLYEFDIPQESIRLFWAFHMIILFKKQNS